MTISARVSIFETYTAQIDDPSGYMIKAVFDSLRVSNFKSLVLRRFCNTTGPIEGVTCPDGTAAKQELLLTMNEDTEPIHMMLENVDQTDQLRTAGLQCANLMDHMTKRHVYIGINVLQWKLGIVNTAASARVDEPAQCKLTSTYELFKPVVINQVGFGFFLTLLGKAKPEFGHMTTSDIQLSDDGKIWTTVSSKDGIISNVVKEEFHEHIFHHDAPIRFIKIELTRHLGTLQSEQYRTLSDPTQGPIYCGGPNNGYSYARQWRIDNIVAMYYPDNLSL